MPRRALVIGGSGHYEHFYNKRGKPMQERQVVVGNYENEIDAEIAKGHLEASGISASIIKDDVGGMFPSLQDAQGVRLLVAERQKEKAERILTDVPEEKS